MNDSPNGIVLRRYRKGLVEVSQLWGLRNEFCLGSRTGSVGGICAVYPRACFVRRHSPAHRVGLARRCVLACRHQHAGSSLARQLDQPAILHCIALRDDFALLGLAPDETVAEGTVSEGSRWFRRGAIAVTVGTVLGWLSYVEVSHV